MVAGHPHYRSRVTKMIHEGPLLNSAMQRVTAGRAGHAGFAGSGMASYLAGSGGFFKNGTGFKSNFLIDWR
jgi:hypothetical protein